MLFRLLTASGLRNGMKETFRNVKSRQGQPAVAPQIYPGVRLDSSEPDEIPSGMAQVGRPYGINMVRNHFGPRVEAPWLHSVIPDGICWVWFLHYL